MLVSKDFLSCNYTTFFGTNTLTCMFHYIHYIDVQILLILCGTYQIKVDGTKIKEKFKFVQKGPLHEILVLIAYVQLPLISTHADGLSRSRGLIFGLSRPLLPYCVYGRSDGSGETAHMCRLIRAFAARRCDKYQNHVCWPIMLYV